MRLSLLFLLPLLSCAGPDSSNVDDTAGGDVDADGFTEDEGDCDDSNAAINPSAVETCDEIDNNCDLAIDEGVQTSWYPDVDADGFGDAHVTATLACTAPAGTVDNAGDCDDTNAAFNPGIDDDCADPTDYNCDGSVGYADADADTFAACEDCDDTNASVNSDAVEVCNGVDDNCDKSTDGPDAEGQSTWYSDADGDGYGDSSAPMDACDMPLGHVADSTDCDDTDATAFPGGGSGSGGSRTFTFTGDVQTFDIPGCATEVIIEAYGAEGVRSPYTSSVAGLGGMARGTLAVTPGDILSIYVGGNDGYNGGGEGWELATVLSNGGGASDVRVGGTDLTDRVIVAGGGGGTSGDSGAGNGGDGGGGSCGANYCGGGGGFGWNSNNGSDGGAEGGRGGSSEHGGGSGGGGLAGGGGGANASSDWYGTATGGTGTLGSGGDGNAPPEGCCQDSGVAGGGGGYYGGGGVAGACCGAGGAGGGSSWTGTLTSPAFAAGVQTGDGEVIIRW